MLQYRHIPLGHLNISDSSKAYVMQALDTNRLSAGPFIKQFEQKFAEEHDSTDSIFMNSGTSALQVALMALKEKYKYNDGDEVIVPAITFIASSNVVIQSNMTPVFVDVCPITYNIDPTQIEKHITAKTKAIMPVHLFGLPCDMDPIMKIAKKYNLHVIEDSCETMFVKYKGRKVGSFGDFGCFSTYVAHLLITGIGGLITTSNKSDVELCRSIMTHGRDSIYLNIDDDLDAKGAHLKRIVERRFSFVRMGYSYRATELEGALGVGELETKDEMMAKRQEIAQYYFKHLASFTEQLQLPVVPEDREHAFMMFPIVVKKGNRDDLTVKLEEAGIETRYMMPLLNQPYYKKIFGNIEDQYPVAKHINNNGFYIPCHSGMSEADIEHIRDIISVYYNQSTLVEN